MPADRLGAVSAEMLDEAMPPACLAAARAANASTRGNWEERVDLVLNAHNKSLAFNGVRCQLCGHHARLYVHIEIEVPST